MNRGRVSRWATTLCLAFACNLVCARSIAAPPSPVPATDLAPVEVEWYGWQILPIDLVSVAGFVLGWIYDVPGLMGASGAVFALGSPIVHLAHGDLYDAALSFGARAGVPALTGGSVWLTREALGEVRCGPEGTKCLVDRPRTTALVTALTAAAIAPLIDQLDLAWTTNEIEASPPVVMFGPDGVQVSLTARF